MKKILIYILSLIVVSLLYKGALFFIIPLFGAAFIPLVLLVSYHKFIFKDNLSGNLFTVLLTIVAILIGSLVNHIGWVYSSGNYHNFFHPDRESFIWLEYCTLINLAGTFVLGLVFLVFKMFQRKNQLVNS
ncbi:hypothetical protein HPK19_02025 [Arthrobacter citreus]|nr:hypothetical protein HPK19_02025 [Arthrobacter citreus]